MLFVKKMNFVNDVGCVISRDNEYKGNINLLLVICSIGMFFLL